MKKSLALFIALIMCFVLTSCKDNPFTDVGEGNESDVENITEASLKLAYSKGDSLDPYNCGTIINTNLMKLCYDGLYTLDAKYEPKPEVASTGIVSGTTVNITLADRMFSDGSAVTSADIVASFERAKDSANYRESLKNFDSVKISSDKMLIFTLLSNDPYALSCLTFPIIKSGTETEMPVGTGRYSFKTIGEDVYLVVNTKKNNFTPNIKTIMLEAIRDSESLESSIEIGNTAFYYDDLSDGTYSRLNANTIEMGINSFVFLGMNNSNSIFGNADVRRVVNLAIDRNKITVTAFQGHARVTYSPFNPDWYILSSRDLYIDRNAEEAKKLIKDSGIEINARSIRLLVYEGNGFKCEAADYIKENLEEIGFSVEIVKCTSAYLTEMVELGGYDIYIGEVLLTYNMNLTGLFDQTVRTGATAEGTTASRYYQFMSGSCEIMDFINTFNEEVPFAPLCYRNAAVSYTNSVKADYACCDADVYCDIDTWIVE